MAHMSEKEFARKLKRIQTENEQREKLRQLKRERFKHFPKLKLPSTSKIILFAVALLCLEIIIFCQYAMISLQDTSAMYVLIGVPVSLIPIVLGYYHKSKAENTAGGIVYETTMAQMANQQVNNMSKDSNNAVG